MVFSIDRTKFKTETGKQLYDLLTNIWANDDFIVGILSEVKGDEKRQRMIDLIAKDNIRDPETLVLAASDIADGIEL